MIDDWLKVTQSDDDDDDGDNKSTMNTEQNDEVT
jgi:hypothetical protein